MRRPGMALLVVWILGACAGKGILPSPAGTPSPEGELIVFAAASLTDPFQELAALFQQQHPGTKVTFNFGASSALRTQILQGAPADLFASADEKNMEEVKQAGRVAEGPWIFATNRLVIVTPASNPGRVTALVDLARPGLRLAMPGPEVPIGAYAREVLARASKDPAYGVDFAERVLRNVASAEPNVKAALSRVALGEADAAFVYRTDVTSAYREKVQVVEIPDALNVIARYPIALLKGAPHPEAGRLFVELLRSPQGQEIMRRWGFGPP
ncbi:molybdate ABC transporter substrate-binding protein [Thermoflexus sp.]|uniref:molybdate ABC transporter substrate-binding protein n=1 Tax=Thermoflexus sp. TaxID=1969742 RepID=UPI001779C2D8|nr:molybdate ABC transporter substrate-binding protein [Thermoflexus sp.]